MTFVDLLKRIERGQERVYEQLDGKRVIRREPLRFVVLTPAEFNDLRCDHNFARRVRFGAPMENYTPMDTYTPPAGPRFECHVVNCDVWVDWRAK